MKIATSATLAGQAVLKLSGELIASGVEELVAAVDYQVKSGDQRIFLDLAEVSFLDSSGLKTCMQLQNRLRAAGGELFCFNAGANVQKVFTITGADRKILLMNSTAHHPDFAGTDAGRRNHFALTMVPIFAEVDLARKVAEEVCLEYYAAAGKEEVVGEVVLAITEAMNNVVEHGKASQVEVELTALPGRIDFVIRSDGLPFDPTVDVAMPDLGGADDLPEGGFGRALILELMDEVKYEFIDGKNVLRLTKIIVS